MGFLYYSPYAYVTSTNLHGFFVTPLGNYHMEDAWLRIARPAQAKRPGLRAPSLAPGGRALPPQLRLWAEWRS